MRAAPALRSARWAVLPRPSSSRAFGTSRRLRRPKARYQYNENPFGSSDPLEEAHNYPLLDAAALAKQRKPPREVKMLSRDFIQDSLYNPHYGYFSTQVEIFDADKVSDGGAAEGIEFGKCKNTLVFEDEVRRRYAVGEEDETSAARQVWHTPTELFKPWYARALAHYIVSTHLASGPSNRPLRLYEIGAGNGTLMRGILDYLRSSHAELYDQTTYTTIEISARLTTLQRASAARGGHAGRVRTVQKDVLELAESEWEPEECFVIATEVLDNLSRDVIRYRKDDLTPLQGMVVVDRDGDFSEHFEPVTDPLLQRFMATRHALGSPFDRPAVVSALEAWSSPWRTLKSSLPLAPNLSAPEFAPTKMFRLLEVLRDRFPQHRLVVTDFDSLPDAIPGAGAPVVQTRYDGVTVPCTTYLVSPGFFDIFFPTDFRLLTSLHSALMPTSTPLTISSHADFLKTWGEVNKTRCADRSNPMLDYYENVAFAVSSK